MMIHHCSGIELTCYLFVDDWVRVNDDAAADCVAMMPNLVIVEMFD